MTLPAVTIVHFRRVDHGHVLAVARVRLGEFVTLPVRLLLEPGAVGPVFDVPAPAADVRLGVTLAPELATAVRDALVTEYAHHPTPGERDVLCRRCDGLVTYHRGRAVDPVTFDPHGCAA